MKRKIPMDEWSGFLESFSLQHDGWLVDVSSGPPAAGTLVREAPLEGITTRSGPGQREVVVTVGGGREEHRQLVAHDPVSIRLESEGGVDQGLEIESKEGVSMRVTICSPIAPELVDGIAP